MHWNIYEYQWTHINDNSVLEKRKNVKGEYVSMRPYYKFYNVLYKFNTEGILLSMNNVNENLELVNDESGIALDKPIYDKQNNLINFKFLDSNNKPVIGSFYRIKDSMTIKEFYQITFSYCYKFRMSTYFFKTPLKYRLPIIVWFDNDKMYAINNCTENIEMNLGAEILEINGVSAHDLYNTLKTTVSADAFNNNFYVGDLNVNFLYYYHSYYGFSDTYRIKFKPYNSEKEIETTFYTDEPIPSYKDEIENASRLNLEINKEKSTAIIRIKNFNYFPKEEQNTDYFKKTIDDYINKINQQEIQKIAFDLRGNRGGNPACTEYLLSYPTPERISFYEDN